MKKEIFGHIDEKDVFLFTLSDETITAKITNFGATIQSILVKDKHGNEIDVVLGYDDLDGYVNDSGAYFGATIGRVANRTANAKFKLNGKKYKIGKNNDKNSLHGGFIGFNKRLFDYSITDEVLSLSYVSPNGEEGYPATLSCMVKFYLLDSTLFIEYEATADDDTVVNLTNHTYFNLSGQDSGEALDNEVYINSEVITPVNRNLIPTGKFLNVKNTPFDFTKPKSIKQDINAKNKQLKICNGYDHNFIVKDADFRKTSRSKSTTTGITLTVFSDQKGVHFYTGNFLGNIVGKGNFCYPKRAGFCFETQNFPNAINCKNFPSPTLKKGEKYKTKTAFMFEVE